ncbi:uncharacterized protein LOC111643085 [Copidosoma floridanum]|uniref:uncharacterized protein LOC111643085 n=1 Tax=Copidosoma floridanum TaxID=29053 RepID=UPI000C6F618F|nr:uncharacterized protein LOC111643085 [Copidosoma floridanum]
MTTQTQVLTIWPQTYTVSSSTHPTYSHLSQYLAVPVGTISPAWSGGSLPPMAGRNSGSNRSYVDSGCRDLGQIVRQWNVKFTGESHDNFDTFLTRITECRTASGLTEEELFRALPELMTGMAATWFRNECDQWISWADFVAEGQEWYGSNEEVQRRLTWDAQMRTQYAGEPVRNFLTQIRNIVRRIQPSWPVERQLDLFHRNMRPELQDRVRRDEVCSLAELLRKATEAEYLLEFRSAFREPPLPEHFYLPESVYKPKTKAVEARKQPKVAGISKTQPGSASSQEITALRKAIEELPKKLASPPEVAGYKLQALYDPGATHTVMQAVEIQIANACGRQLRLTLGSAAMADRRPAPTLGLVPLPFELGGVKRDVDVIGLPELYADCYVSANLINAFGTVQDPVNRVLVIKGQEIKVPLEVAGLTASGEVRLPAIGLNEISSKQQEGLQTLLDRYVEREAPLRCTTWVEHEIEVTTSRPIKTKCNPASDKIQEVIHAHVSEMLESGVVEPSNSVWASPVVMIRKKDGKYRFCVDYQKVNAVTVPNAYPLPHMDKILRKLRWARFISTLDLGNAYHQIPLAEKDKPISAFTVPGKGLFHFQRLPFGLSNALATLQRLINRYIGPELEPYACTCLDDTLIVTETFEEHLKWLEHVLKRVRDVGLTLNLEKSEFCQSEIRYLGVLVNRDGLRADLAKLKPITAFPAPKSLKGRRRFLSMVSWYRKFLPNYLTVVEPQQWQEKSPLVMTWGPKKKWSEPLNHRWKAALRRSATRLTRA